MTLFRGIAQGVPGSCKTSLAVCLANAGYRIIRCGFEGGHEVFDAYCTPEGRARVHNFMFEDDFDNDKGLVRVPKGMKAFEEFIYNGRYGREVPLDRPSTWGADTVVMVDTTTSLGDCCEAYEEQLNPKNPMAYLTDAARAQVSMAKLMTSSKRGYHTLWLAHLNLISPSTESGFKNETELQKEIKRDRAKLEETGYFPTIVTKAIARNFIGSFPFALLCEHDAKATNPSGCVVRTVAVPGYQIKCPLAGIKDKLPIESAMITIFKALGNTLRSSTDENTGDT